MAAAEKTEVFPCTPEQLWAVISDFAKYPEFLSEVRQCRVVGEKDGEKLVEFQVAMVKSFTYRILVKEDAPRRMSWHLDSGDVFKSSDGSWDLTEKDGQTVAKYAVDATFKVLVPGFVAKALVEINLPNMMKAYQSRVRDLYHG